MVFFVREIMETNPKLRPTILTRLLDTFSQIRSSRVCSCALWILSEYCTNPQDINAALEVNISATLPGVSSELMYYLQSAPMLTCSAGVYMKPMDPMQCLAGMLKMHEHARKTQVWTLRRKPRALLLDWRFTYPHQSCRIPGHVSRAIEGRQTLGYVLLAN